MRALTIHETGKAMIAPPPAAMTIGCHPSRPAANMAVTPIPAKAVEANVKIRKNKRMTNPLLRFYARLLGGSVAYDPPRALT